MEARRCPDRRSRAILAVAVLGLWLGACRRSTEEWVADLTAHDEWHRHMAALALRTAPDPDLERAFRAVLRRGRERSPAVVEALQDTLHVLGDRRPDLVRRAIASLAAERRNERLVLAEILLQQLRRGDEQAREPLRAYLEEERVRPSAGLQAAVEELRRALEALPAER